MATYVIVSKDATNLQPGEIRAGETLALSDGDTVIISPTADDDVTLTSASGLPIAFDVEFSGDNANAFKLNFQDHTSPTITIPDNTALPDIDIDGDKADATTMIAGDNVFLGKYNGSNSGPDTITIGNGFHTDDNWHFGDGGSTITIGDDATLRDIITQDGVDNITIGDNATMDVLKTGKGDDVIWIGDNFTATKVEAQDGDDWIYMGANANVNEVDGGNGNDTFNTQTTGTNNNKMENTSVVCFAAGTLIETPEGARPVEELRPKDQVLTLDAGVQPILWVHCEEQQLACVASEDRPVLIAANALGPSRPTSDLVVSPQHRILVGGRRQLEAAFSREYFVPAKALTALPGIRSMNGRKQVTWVHIACGAHQIVTANGLLAESMLLGPMALACLKAPERRELIALFGKPEQPGAALNGPPVRPCIGARPARAKLLQHRQRRPVSQRPSHLWDNSARTPAQLH